MESKKEGGYVRVSEKTKRVINMFAAELQLATGETKSADDAIWEAFERHMPELAKRAVDASHTDRAMNLNEKQA